LTEVDHFGYSNNSQNDKKRHTLTILVNLMNVCADNLGQSQKITRHAVC